MGADIYIDALPPLLDIDDDSKELLLPGYSFVKAYLEIPDGQGGRKIEKSGVLDVLTTMEAQRRTVNAAADYIEASWETESPITDLVVALKGGSVLTRDLLLELEKRQNDRGGNGSGRLLNIRTALKVDSNGMANAQYLRGSESSYILSDNSPIEGRALMIDDIIDTVEALRGIQSAIRNCGSKLVSSDMPLLVAFSPLAKGEDTFFNKPSAYDLMITYGFNHQNIWDHQPGGNFDPFANVFTCLTCEGVWLDTGIGLASDKIKPQNKPEDTTIQTNDILPDRPTLQLLNSIRLSTDLRVQSLANEFLATYFFMDSQERLTPCCITGDVTDVDGYIGMLESIAKRYYDSLDSQERQKVMAHNNQLMVLLMKLLREQMELEFEQINGKVNTAEDVKSVMQEKILAVADGYFQRFNMVKKRAA